MSETDKKRQPKAVSNYFSQLAAKSWEVRKKKLLAVARISKNIKKLIELDKKIAKVEQKNKQIK